MRIALAQLNISNEIDENYKKSLQMIERASAQGADLLCFPEIQLSPFFPQYKKKDVSEYVLTWDSQYIRGICDACKVHQLFASHNFYVEENGKRYDMSLLINADGQVIGKQKMVHIAQCKHFYEQSYYSPSEEGFRVFDTPFGKIGIVVCFDRHYPESIRTEALRGANLILIPTANTKAEPSELFQWEIRVQAFQNSVNIAMCNRTGKEDDMIFSGESMITDPNGDLIAVAGEQEELLIADVDLAGAEKIRKQKPYMSLRRSDLYE